MQAATYSLIELIKYSSLEDYPLKNHAEKRVKLLLQSAVDEAFGKTTYDYSKKIDQMFIPARMSGFLEDFASFVKNSQLPECKTLSNDAREDKRSFFCRHIAEYFRDIHAKKKHDLIAIVVSVVFNIDTSKRQVDRWLRE